MKKWTWAAITAACAIAATSSCVLFVQVEETTLRVYNNMRNVTVVVGRGVYPVEKIDLYGVTIGDVYFDRIRAGTVTAEVETDYRGNVDISIDKAVAYVTVDPLGIIPPDEYTFEGIEDFSTYISAETMNTVEFDKASAGTIFSYLPKRPAQR